MDDYLEAGGLIIARLKERLPDLRVAPSWSLAEIRETPELAPSLLVFLEGDTPGEGIPNGCDHKVEQRWAVVVIARDAEGEAGFMISRTLSALAGWRPPGGRFSSLRRVASSHTPDRTPAGVFYFPVAFATGFVFNVSD